MGGPARSPQSPSHQAPPEASGSGSGAGSPASGSGPRAKGAPDNAQGTFFLGRYRVVDEIGVGGMASVHLARMDGPGGFQKWVAIKRIHPHLVEDDQFVDMFLDEARIAAGINHANVAQVFDLGKDDNTYWIAMEYLHGEPLREVMRRAEDRGQRIAPELAARICADAAEGLHAAHELRGKNGQLLGLVHRDVTPHNLFVTYDGYTKVVDFGIAKVADRLSSTRAGTLKGKLAYMSPEQVRGAEVDRTTDIFALGVVLWEITTNQRLFRMDTDLDTLEKVQACVVPPPSTIVPGYPAELEACVMKALSKRKQDRFATAREFSRALQQSIVRTGQFIGPEEVAQFVRSVFSDRIQKREAHLAWAAEVTGTLNIDQLRKKQAGSEPSSMDDLRRDARDGTDLSGRGAATSSTAPTSSPSGPKPPAFGKRTEAMPAIPSQMPSQNGAFGGGGFASGGFGAKPPPPAGNNGPPPPQLAAASLMDDDEDVPTTVATRETLEEVANRMRMPLPGQAQAPSPASYAANAANAANAGGASNGANGFGGPGFGQGQPGLDRTHALADLGSTVALPSMPLPNERPTNQALGNGGGNGRGGPAPSFGAPPSAWGPVGGPAPTFGQPQGNPALTPAGMVGGLPVLPMPPSGPGGGYPGMPGHPGSPQSQIETAISLPRPDPTALWLAQQERQKGERRNIVVLVAVVALTALCVLGIGALLFFKLRARAQVPAPETPATDATAVVSAAPSGSPGATPGPNNAVLPSGVPSGLPSAAPSSSAAADAPAASANATSTAATAQPASAAPSNAGGSGTDPGYLTITCNPGCDNVLDGGKSLGAAPVVHRAVSPGSHRLTLKNGRDAKVISVIVVSGQVTAQRVAMK